VSDTHSAKRGLADDPKRPVHPAQSGWHPAEWGCEFVGTLLLVLGGISAVVLDFGSGSRVATLLPSHSVRLLLTGLLFGGCGSLVAISPIGRRSGAHLNPSITVAFWCRRHVSAADAVGYVVAQCLGALCGAALVRLAWGARAASIRDGVTLPGRGISALEAIGIEASMTGLLVLIVFSFVSSNRTARWTPAAAWVAVAVLVWRGAPYTGTSLNAARSLGPVVVSGIWSDFFVYLVGPVMGALIAVAMWVVVPRETLTAKLFHDPRYPSVLRSSLPVRR
jgi:aquaporin Z